MIIDELFCLLVLTYYSSHQKIQQPILNYNNFSKTIPMQHKKSQKNYVDQNESLWKLCIKAILLFLLIPFIYYLYLQNSYESEDHILADQITFIVIASGRINLLDETIGSLLSSKSIDNQSKFMVIYDGNKTEQVSQYIKNQDKIVNSKLPFEWIITESILGQLACIDLAFSKVKTKYAFLSLGNWRFSEKNFIEPAIKVMRADNRVSQVVVTEIMGLLEKNVQKLSALDTPAYGFTLLPSLHQINAYRKLPGGFANLTYNATYGYAAGVSELIISQFFQKMNYHVQILNQSFAQKISTWNPVYNTLQFQDRYGYLGVWKMPESQKWICRLMLKIGNAFMRNNKLYRLERRRINKLLKLKSYKLKDEYEKYGFATNIQIGSQFDYIGINKKKQFLQIVETFPKTFYYQAKPIWSLRKDMMKSQVLQRKIKLSKINTSESFHKFLQSKNISNLKTSKSNEDAIKLGLTLLSKPNDLQAMEAEYFFYYYQEKLQQNTAQSKICAFISGQNLMSRIKMNNLLQSINRQNYSNYQFVVSVDKNSDQSMSRIFQIIQAYYPKLFNRLKIALYNEEKLGHPGNHYVRMKQFCRGSQIVLTLNGNSTLIGRQVFNVINSLFKDSDNWITFFSPIIQKNLTFSFSDMNIKGKNLRLAGLSTDQYLVAFRFEIGDLLPISQVMQLKYDTENDELHPKFIQSQSNDFHIYSYCQMSGQSRIRYYQSYPIYHYNQIEKKQDSCNLIKENWQKMKARIRYPLNKLSSLKDTPIFNTSFEISNTMLTQISSLYENLTKCSKTSQNPVNQKQFNVFLQNSLSKMVSPDYYMPTDQNIKVNQMPFCLVIDANLDQITFNRILDSIKQQNYENYTLLIIQQTNAKDFKFERKRKEQIETLNVALPNKSHQSYRHALRELCSRNSLVMFLNKPLKKNVILELNSLHQRQNSWMTYSKTDAFVQIISIYLRVYQLVQFNDFDKSNQKYLVEGDQQLITLIILQLCPKFSSHKHYEMIYEMLGTQQYNHGYLQAQIRNKQLYQRSSYQYLFTLQQDYSLDFDIKQNLQKKSQRAYLHSTKPSVNSFIRKSQFLKAFEYDQIPFIPDNHFLNQRQFRELQQKFKISEFMSDPKKQVRFCLTIFGRNNTQFGRYWKILQTIKMQKYENYHVILLDDDSDDRTLELSIQYLEKINFPREKLTFVKNNKRVYATYNILNSAFNYCHEDDIQVRFDGDDFMLGRHVFNLFNTFYQRNPNIWVAYTNYKSNDYTYGLAADFNSTEQLMNCMGTFRRRIHFITPITTWRVKLIRAIPLKYHQREPGVWFNTLYDDALQFSFVELATLDRIKYIPYINYHYNQNYGSNDNSNEQKERDRIFLFKQVIQYEPLLPLKSLDDPRVKNHEMIAEFAKDKKNKVFQQIKN